jgi:hypothetical protein
MRKLILSKDFKSPSDAFNTDTLMRSFLCSTFTPNFNTARFSNPAVAAQRGFFQRLNSLVYVYIELCPDINNPYGGGATVSFNAGDAIKIPLPSIEPKTYTAGDWIGHNTATLSNVVSKNKYSACYFHTNPTTGEAEVVIDHNIGNTAATFVIEGFYITKV